MELKENMRILYRGMSLGGGAPKSAYQYLRVFKQDGHRISVIMQEREQSLKELYEREFGSLTVMPNVVDLFEKRAFVQLYRQLCGEYKALKTNKPDLVLAFGTVYPFFYGRFCRELQIPCIQFIAGGDLAPTRLFLRKVEWCHSLCFSEENRDVLRGYIPDEHINVISNRIELKKQFNDLPEHISTAKNGIRILLTSRISQDKYESVVGFVDNLCCAANVNTPVTLAVAGGGDKLESLKKYVSDLENPFVSFEIKGHLDNLVPEFERAHLVVGRGRSVLEPIMMNRPGCVIGDNGSVELCTPENFDHLYHYNFSGRESQCDDPVAVLSRLLDSLLHNTLDVEKTLCAAQLAREQYSAEYLREKLYAALDSVEFKPERKFHIPVAVRLAKFALIRLMQKIVNKKK